MNLGVNIDHVATLRNVRGGGDPDLLSAAVAVWHSGAEQLVCHLREDRRHIHDQDLKMLRDWGRLPLNLEMAMTEEMARIAINISPDLVTLVPERREERTTEGGLLLDMKTSDRIRLFLDQCRTAGVRVSLFLGPDPIEMEKAILLGVDQIELHTGEYANAVSEAMIQSEMGRLRDASVCLMGSGIRLAAGHGLNSRNLRPVLGLPGLKEVNIGHSIISRSLFVGLEKAIGEIRKIMTDAEICRAQCQENER
ncbi:MAG: pyridoxine 5'-phosphate synthase [Leptospirales bacterium]